MDGENLKWTLVPCKFLLTGPHFKTNCPLVTEALIVPLLVFNARALSARVSCQICGPEWSFQKITCLDKINVCKHKLKLRIHLNAYFRTRGCITAGAFSQCGVMILMRQCTAPSYDRHTVLRLSVLRHDRHLGGKFV